MGCPDASTENDACNVPGISVGFVMGAAAGNVSSCAMHATGAGGASPLSSQVQPASTKPTTKTQNMQYARRSETGVAMDASCEGGYVMNTNVGKGKA